MLLDKNLNMRWAWIMVGLKSSNTFLEEIHKKKHKREGHVKAEREKEIRNDSWDPKLQGFIINLE